MMEDNNPIIEEREERMVSPEGGHVRRRTAHFLGPVAAPPLNCSVAAKYTDLPLKVNYRGWKSPPKNWKSWVNQLLCLHQSTWTKSGIIDAITSSTCTIHRHNDLILGLVEKWCSATNSFVFPWGEATITLEDVTVLGGFPVLGESVLVPPGDVFETVEKLQNARLKLTKDKAKKATQGKWIAKFMGSKSEIEHEAFLAFWLSRFVFPFSPDAIGGNVMPIAAQLARGRKLALAPALLACIYKSLTLLKAAITAARNKHGQDCVVEVTVPAPLAIVQVWVWERFPSLAPPNPRSAAPRLGRWDELKSGLGFDSSTIDSCGEEFRWRPYGRVEAEMEGRIRWLRVSEVVGLEEDCIEQYLPHRVARQFGLDQDIPGDVARDNVSPEVAWRNYSRPIVDGQVYVPSGSYEACVTSRYLEWWNEVIRRWGAGKKRGLFGNEWGDDFVAQPRGFCLKWKSAEEGGIGKSSEGAGRCGERERLDCNGVGGEGNVCDLGSGSEGKNDGEKSEDEMVRAGPPDLNESEARSVVGGGRGAEWESSIEMRISSIEKVVAALEAGKAAPIR